MKKANLKFSIKPALAACLCVVMLVGCMGAAYAADVGGIRETIRIWINGKQVDADIVDCSGDGSGSYHFIVDPEGAADSFDAGGIAIEDDGSTRPLTPEEVACQFSIDVDVDENGRVWLYYYEQSYDITGLLADGACRVSLENGDSPLYFDIEDNGSGGYAYSMSSEPTGSPAEYTGLK